MTHMKPWKAEDGSCYFGGWARMAQPIVGFSVVEVSHRVHELQGLGYSYTVLLLINLKKL